MSPGDVETSSPAAATRGAGAEYIVVARRYRPQTFVELVGQEHVAQALTGAIESQRVGHAYLFAGARGVGKTSAARILAKSLNCVRGPTAQPCNECDLCQAISLGADVDVLEIDGASNRGIDEMRELRHNVNVRPSRARFKIYIIDEVHMLTREAFNALLKTLEEPPEHVKFIFCTTEPEKIPVTILSRCQRFDFSGIGTFSIAERLRQIAVAEGVEAEPAALAALARRGAGSMRDSQSLLEQLLASGGERITLDGVHRLLGTAGEQRFAQLAGHLVAHDAAMALADLDTALADGVDVGPLLDQLLGYFRDVMVTSVGVGAEHLLYASENDAQAVASAAKGLGVARILAIMQVLEQTLARLRYSSQARILVELALVRICQLDGLEQISDLVDELRSGVGRHRAPDASKTGAREAPAVAPDNTSKKNAESSALAEGSVLDSATSSSVTPPVPYLATPNGEAAVEPGFAWPPDTDSVNLLWQQALKRLPGLFAEQASMAARVATGMPNRLVVTFEQTYNSCKAYCERAEQVGQLQRVLEELTGNRIYVAFDVIEPGDASRGDFPLGAVPRGDFPRGELPRAAAKRNPRQQLREISEHPFVRRAMELLDAEPVRVESES